MDRAITVGLASALLASLLTILVITVKNMQLNHEIKNANEKITQLEANQNTLKTAVQIQNDSVDLLIEESDKAIAKSEQALQELKPFVEEEERRILGIRSAQHSSASSDPAERLEAIRQKMLADALL